MTRKDAIDTLITLAVCSIDDLPCSEYCPLYAEEMHDVPIYESVCKDAWTDASIIEAVKVLKERDQI